MRKKTEQKQKKNKYMCERATDSGYDVTLVSLPSSAPLFLIFSFLSSAMSPKLVLLADNVRSC